MNMQVVNHRQKSVITIKCFFFYTSMKETQLREADGERRTDEESRMEQ